MQCKDVTEYVVAVVCSAVQRKDVTEYVVAVVCSARKCLPEYGGLVCWFRDNEFGLCMFLKRVVRRARSYLKGFGLITSVSCILVGMGGW